jgi:hypothetical protein
MSKAARSDLSEAMQRVSAPREAQRPREAPTATAPTAAAEKKKLTIYLDAATHRGLRQLAVDRDSNINAIVGELIAGELKGARP